MQVVAVTKYIISDGEFAEKLVSRKRLVSVLTVVTWNSPQMRYSELSSKLHESFLVESRYALQCCTMSYNSTEKLESKARINSCHLKFVSCEILRLLLEISNFSNQSNQIFQLYYVIYVTFKSLTAFQLKNSHLTLHSNLSISLIKKQV